MTLICRISVFLFSLLLSLDACERFSFDDLSEVKNIKKMSPYFYSRKIYDPDKENYLQSAYRYLRGIERDPCPKEITREDLEWCEINIQKILDQRSEFETRYYDKQVEDLRRFHAKKRINIDFLKQTVIGCDSKEPFLRRVFSEYEEHEAALNVIAATFSSWFKKVVRADYIESQNLTSYEKKLLDAAMEFEFVKAVLIKTYYDLDFDLPDQEKEICIDPATIRSVLTSIFSPSDIALRRAIDLDTVDENKQQAQKFEHQVTSSLLLSKPKSTNIDSSLVSRTLENLSNRNTDSAKIEKISSVSHHVVNKYINRFLKDESAFPDIENTYFSLIDSNKVHTEARWSVEEMIHTIIFDSLRRKGYSEEKAFDLIDISLYGKIPKSRLKNISQGTITCSPFLSFRPILPWQLRHGSEFAQMSRPLILDQIFN